MKGKDYLYVVCMCLAIFLSGMNLIYAMTFTNSYEVVSSAFISGMLFMEVIVISLHRIKKTKKEDKK